jgi:hypothetical protein
VWERLHQVVLERLNAAGEIDWSRAAADARHIRALLGGSSPAPRRSTVLARAQSITS